MSQIFISYSRRDSNFVDQLVSELEAWGVDVWVDTGEILAGEAWRCTIEENFERLVRSLISLGLDVQPKLEPKVTKDIEIEKQSTSNSAALASISQPDSATSSITTSNLFQSIPVQLWAVGGLVIIIGLAVLLMRVFGGGAADQLTPTLETVIAVLPLEETKTPTPQKKPTNTATDEPTETEEPAETLEPTEISAHDLEPTETILPTFTPTPSKTPHPPIIEDDFGVSMVLV